MPADKKIEISIGDLATIHQLIFNLHPTGVDIKSVSNCLSFIEQIMSKAQKEENKDENVE